MSYSNQVLSDAAISTELMKLCLSSESVSSVMAIGPTLAPGNVWKTLYGQFSVKPVPAEEKYGHEEIERALMCGKWGPAKPGQLFARIYRDVLAVVDQGLEKAVVSPSLLGSSGVVPLTVISTIPDIVRHMANVIVRADKEVFLATDFWENSAASQYVTNSLHELDRRAGSRGDRVVVKIMYDRGSPKQAFDPHYLVSESEYTGKNVNLPAAKDIPNIDLQVMNYHKPLLGTFHSKFMVVDRRIAILQSNNMQDNDNLEMMIQLEGPIVDSFYDMALISWHKALDPPLPLLNSPASTADIQCLSENGGMTTLSPPLPADTTVEKGIEQLVLGDDQKAVQGPEKDTDESGQLIPNKANGPDAETQAFLQSGKQTVTEPSILQPVAPGTLLPQSTPDHPQYDATIAAEVVRAQYAVTPKPGEPKMAPVSRLLNHTVNHLEADAPDYPEGQEMTPYIAHAVNQTFPIAMVNRTPYGKPVHWSGVQPQNAAWMSALQNARKNVFIHSPTLNAEALVPAIREACERGIDVICFVSLGYDDAGELLPKQGGTNEMVAHGLYESLSDNGREHLHYFWYVAKDQTRPIPQTKKQRDCHIKLMIVDEYIGIMGNGNLDTQSWFHSQEINVMLESVDVCEAWIDGLLRNQNTHIYGMLDKKDGIWRDYNGLEAAGSMGIDPKCSMLKGILGTIKRVQGKGGF